MLHLLAVSMAGKQKFRWPRGEHVLQYSKITKLMALGNWHFLFPVVHLNASHLSVCSSLLLFWSGWFVGY